MASLKSFYSVLDIGCTSVTSQRGQHVIIADMAQQRGGKITFYTAEDPQFIERQYTLRARIRATTGIDGIVFFRLKQFAYGSAFDFAFMRDLLKGGYSLHFAREQFSIETLAELGSAYDTIYAFQHEERGAADARAISQIYAGSHADAP